MLPLLPYVGSLVISCGVGMYAWRRRTFTGARPYAFFALAQAAWILAYIFELNAESLDTKILWDKVQFLAMLVLLLPFWHFVQQYTQHTQTPRHPHAHRRALAILAGLTLLGWLVVLADPRHGQIYHNPRVIPGNPFNILDYEFTPTFLLLTSYVVVVGVSGLYALLAELRHAPASSRMQIGTIVIGLVIPLSSGLFTIAGVELSHQRDVSPLAFALGNLVVAWGLFRYHLFELVPIARATIIENLRDAVFVIDTQQRLLDFNPAAARLSGLNGAPVVGRPVASLFPHWHHILARYPDLSEETQFELTTGEAGDERVMEIRLSPVHDMHGAITGRLAVIRDITQRKQTESELYAYRNSLEAMIRERTADLLAVNTQLLNEIDERERTQQALQINEERYRRATSAGKVGVWEWDMQEDRLYIAPELKRMLGYSVHELDDSGAIWHKLIVPEDLERLNSIIKDLVTNSNPVYETQLRMLHKHGSERWMAMRGTAIRDTEQRIVRMAGTTTDITDMMRMLQALQRRDAILQAVSRAAEALLKAANWHDVAAEMLSALGRATQVEIAAIFEAEQGEGHTWHFRMRHYWIAKGIPEQIVTGNRSDFTVVPSDYYASLQRWQRGETVTRHTRDMPAADRDFLLRWQIESLLDVPIVVQTQLWGLVSLHKRYEQRSWMPTEIDAIQTAASILGTAVERQHARRSLQQYASRLNTLHQIDLAILAAQSAESIAYAALQALQQIVPCQRTSVALFDTVHHQAQILTVHSTGSELQIPPGAIVDLNDTHFTGLRDGSSRIIDNLQEFDPDGPVTQKLLREHIYSVMNVPLLYEDNLLGTLNLGASQPGRFTHSDLETVQQIAAQLAVGIHQAHLRDQVQAYAEELEQRVAARTAELEAANRDLQALSRVKDEFVSNVSHELRTPISNLKLYLNLLAMRPARATSYAGTLTRETDRLERLIEALLMLSRLDQDRVTFRLTPTDLNALAQEYATDRGALAERHNLTLRFIPDGALRPVLADQNLLGQVLSILLTNAFHYTPENGCVTIRTATLTQNGQDFAGFSVSDTGPGIPPDEHTQLFSRFFRGQAGRDSGVSGTGLGLAIAKEITDRHDGYITVDSNGIPGEGTTFSVWIPTA